MQVSGCHIPEDAYCQSIDLECYNSCLDGHVGKVYRGGCRSLARYCIVLISKTKSNKCWNQALLCPEDVTRVSPVAGQVQCYPTYYEVTKAFPNAESNFRGIPLKTCPVQVPGSLDLVSPNLTPITGSKQLRIDVPGQSSERGRPMFQLQVRV